MVSLSKKYSKLARITRVNKHIDMEREVINGTPEQEAERLITSFQHFAPNIERAKQCATLCLVERERALTLYGGDSLELQNMDAEFRYIDKVKEAVKIWQPNNHGKATLSSAYGDMVHSLLRQQDYHVKHELDRVYTAGQESIEYLINSNKLKPLPKDDILKMANKNISTWLLYQPIP